MNDGPGCRYYLTQAGIDLADARELRRISMTLHRWHEAECNGDIERGEASGRPYYVWTDERGHRRQSDQPIADRERGALRRLAKIMARYPGFQSYVQGDPRGCALYILRPGDVREGDDVSSVYTRGIAVYK